MASQETIELKVSDRVQGKGNSRQMRMKEMIPAVVYGPKIENMNFCLPELEAYRLAKHKFDNVIISLKSDNAKLNNLKVMRKDFDVHPLSRRPLHLDFYALDMSQTIRVNVELRFEGKPAGAAEGGLLNVISRDVELECMPGDIPEFIVVDVSNLGLNESIHASDLKLSEKVKMITDPMATMATCAVAREEAPAEVPAAAAEGAAVAEGAPAAAGAAGAAAPAAEGAKDAKGKKE
jgi:large subunit ribosomal protein L25